MPNSGAAMPSAVNTQAPAADVFSTPVGASKRTAATVDQDSLEKTTKLKARKNLDVAIKVLFREHIGSGNRHNYSATRTNERYSYRLVVY
jgi:hypothetical protein